ncbi:amidohydrolase family protein [Methanobrevibacter sp. TMH8]|uniref:amidohydrolase family protein n=1 Tax=Methanobrevibacter sp. TMH8 TaxID=2848611 RepID=UPI001CC9D784|nr:amidohydrolase family protein [Methanobrevibacter sp. TMH8]MBZ9570002.1 amidohydrolase family protein [Methanobrevibacter sp. TMH8]
MITISNGTVLFGPDLIAKNTNILIDNGRIIEISNDVVEGEIIDATDCIVCPSFLNAHTHIGDSIIKDIGDGKSIDEIVKPPNGLKHLELEKSSDKDLIDSMKETMWNMLETGTTHFIDYREGGLKGVNLLKKAAKDIPINPIILGRDDSFYDEDPNLSKVKIAIKKILKVSDGIAPSGFGEISDEVAFLIVSECKKKGKLSSIHAGEYEALQKDSLNNTGKTEIQKAVEAGFNQIVHITSPLNDDLDLISKNNKNVVLCPRSNGAFSVGIPPLMEIFKKGIKPLIGTDNIMINSPNIFRELEYTLKIMKAFYKEYIAPKDILKMATTNVCIAGSLNNNIDLDNNLNYGDNSNKEKIMAKNDFKTKINKLTIEKDNFAQLFIVKKLSKNPYLSLINRSETKDIICVMNKDKLVCYN